LFELARLRARKKVRCGNKLKLSLGEKKENAVKEGEDTSSYGDPTERKAVVKVFPAGREKKDGGEAPSTAL